MPSGMKLKLSLFGESHGPAVGVTIEGFPAGFAPDWDKLKRFLRRRSARGDGLTTSRIEEDDAEILSGVYRGRTTGTPLTALFRNRSICPRDYESIADQPRPGHADYPAIAHSRGFEDLRGGGFHSGRLTLPYAFAGGLALQVLETKGIRVAAHLQRLGGIADDSIDGLHPDFAELLACHERALPVLNETTERQMEERVRSAAKDGDSLGAVVECVADGLPAGLGLPWFDSVEALLSAALFSIPAVKGVEFGLGFACAEETGSRFNDPYRYEGGRIVTAKNDNGGLLGGMSNGMPLLFRAAFRPTPSIALPQQTVSLREKKERELLIKGRHDPCCAIRAVPVVESATALTLLDLLLAQEAELAMPPKDAPHENRK